MADLIPLPAAEAQGRRRQMLRTAWVTFRRPVYRVDTVDLPEQPDVRAAPPAREFVPERDIGAFFGEKLALRAWACAAAAPSIAGRFHRRVRIALLN
jgi:hypothetical protein